MGTADPVATTATAADHLWRLGELLRTRGLHVRVGATAGGVPQLIVISMTVPTLSEVIFAARGGDHWWFWWSWAERIAPVTDTQAAVALVCDALRPRRSDR
ncbi:hypothetical protein Sme01_32480 [Sphaerisporangium melleum]|uniref:Uncharacterized protein n=1 Tax=Sphaerisporangium melleum TaxID=321316 RepID=A0A917RIT4_9ACTN|nr:hypothetical protein [Sphaerisporangium melleum]GGL10155.1 hypothetical protein GCM10007964_60410 [Sphaerisporangium melleum]GII70772.1 hypothetical protein Sme01_32480 [Sphaerisporangium melleum]